MVVDIYRESTKRFLSVLVTLHLNKDSLFLILKFILENYRFDLRFLKRCTDYTYKLIFTPSPSGNEDKGEKNEV